MGITEQRTHTVTYGCDRCGVTAIQHIDQSDLRGAPDAPEGWREIRSYTPTGIKDGDIVLCADCATALREFIAGRTLEAAR